MVPYFVQAARVAEIVRRLGRLFGRDDVTLPPRFSYVEEGDWITGQSDRHYGGATKTFRVEAWGSDEGLHHQLTLREISAAAFADVAPPPDNAIAVQQPGPGGLNAPGADAWTLTGSAVEGVSGSIPVLKVTGAIDSTAAQQIRVDYRLFGETGWTPFGIFAPASTSFVISPVADETSYEVSLRYVVDGSPTPRLILGPVVTGALSSGGGGAT
jgi:hypothetical protein